MEASNFEARSSQASNDNSRVNAQDKTSTSASNSEDVGPRQSIESSSSSTDSMSSEASSSASESAPPAHSILATPPGSVIQDANAGASVWGRSHFGEDIASRPSRSESTASRTNRLSMTLPIALSTSASSRPTPASSSVSSFAATPNDLASDVEYEPVDLITAIAARERRVLELREELEHTEQDLKNLKSQFAFYEKEKVYADLKNTDRTRIVASRPAAISSDGSFLQNSRLDRKKALSFGQHGYQQGTNPSTPTQSRRRVLYGKHARTLSLLSPSKSMSDGFVVNGAQTADAEEGESSSLPTGMDPSFLQNTGRYAPAAANQISKRASWAPQSVQQVASAGLKQVAGDFTATLRTFMEDLRQATVGEELGGSSSSIRAADPSSRATEGAQSSPTPAQRTSSTADTSSGDVTDLNGKAGNASISGSNSSSKLNSLKNGSKLAYSKDAKRFSWTPLTVDAYDDNDWSSWDSPAANSPRWSGSTANGDMIVTSIPEQAAENTTPQYVRIP
ncbi:hypothetical protein SEPCBS119000_000387 [Sporothrix epigloea]|uniref:DUF4048 domain-containing protein n=1 Tax=Sporothrix epigloea TaxID=1892477 RepID=A0ABP0D7X7_9PEZI